MINIIERKPLLPHAQFDPPSDTMNSMRTPFRLVFLALLGACTNGAVSTTPTAVPTDSKVTLVEASFHPQQAGTEEDAYRLYEYADGQAAMELYTRLLEQTLAARSLARNPLNPEATLDREEIARLDAELEWLAIGFVNAAGVGNNQTGARQLLDSLALNPTLGLTWSLLQWGHPDRVARLGRLYDWQFLGPFDNERGAAMDTALPAESAPATTLSFAGKIRAVTWRNTPKAVPPGAHLDFSKLIYPSQQCALLLRTWVQAPSDVDATLLLGVDGEVRAWHDGTPILDAPERHQLRVDALAAPLSLHAGWNEIALKLGSRDHAPLLNARLVDRNGAPLLLQQSSSPPAEILAASLAPTPAPIVPLSAHPGALAYYLDRTEKHPNEAQAFFRLATLENFYQVFPKAQHAGRETARQAVELAPDNIRYRSFYATTLFPDDGTPATEVDLNPWLQQALQVLAQDPTNPTILSERAQAATLYQHLEPLALDSVNQLVAACKQRPMTRAFRAATLSSFNHDLLAEREFRALLADPSAQDYPNLCYRALQIILPSASPERLPQWETIFAKTPRADVQQQIFSERRRQRDHFDADLEREELEQMLKLDPWNSRLLDNAAARFQSQGDLDTAFSLVHQALALNPELPASLALLARLHLAAGQHEEAVLALEKELDIDYSAEEESRLLDHLLALEGASFEEAYRESLDTILERHPEASVEEDAQDYSHEYLLYRTVIRIHPDSTAHRYMRKVIRIKNANGIRKLDVVHFPYVYGDEDLRVEKVLVRHLDGSEESARTARGWRGRQVDLPQLQIGDIIDMEWRIDDLHTTFFGKYFGLDHEMTPDRSVPTRESQLVLLVPQELPLAFHPIRLPGVEAQVAETENFGTSHSWTAFALAPERMESLMPPSEETVPRVQASSYASWDAFGTWWWNLIDAGITVSPEMRAKVAQLTADKNSLRDKVAAIYAFVANDIRYNAWEFGVHGYQPYTAPVIFSRQFGDCKDKGILIRAMLSEIQVEAYPVLILRTADGRHGGRRFEEDLSLAMVNHFNHCIAYIPAQQDLPAMFVDGTARLHPMDVLPYDDRGAQVLVVKPDGIERVRIPFSKATDNTKAQNFHITYHADASADARLVLQPSGRYDPLYRNTFAGGDQDRKESVQRILTSLFGPLEGSPTYDIPDVEQLEQPLVYLLGGHPASLARKVDGGLEIPFMFDRQELLQSLAAETTRTTDLLLDSPKVRDVTYEFTLPKGWALDTLPAAVMGSTEDASYRWEIEALDSGAFRIKERFELLTHRIPLARYSAFRDLCRLVDSTQDRFLGATRPQSEEDSQ